ncbi:MAG: winged helix-turn-helix transcriptional regulator [Candidatus Dormibacteria bacterium]
MSEQAEASAPGLEAALERVGDRWALLLVEALLQGPRRYTDLQRRLPAIATNVLSERLRRLERSGLVQSRPYSRRPPRAEYQLTQQGRGLAGVVEALGRWGGAGAGLGPVHSRCGTTMELRFYCPTCDLLVVPGEAGSDDDLVFA